jgi:hypothetical protein
MNLTIVFIIGYTYLGVREFPSIDPLKSPLELIIREPTQICGSQITEPLEKAINSIDGLEILRLPVLRVVVPLR